MNSLFWFNLLFFCVSYECFKWDLNNDDNLLHTIPEYSLQKKTYVGGGICLAVIEEKEQLKQTNTMHHQLPFNKH